MTQCRVWIASGTRDNLSKALERLLSARRELETLHMVSQLIEVLVLQSVALEKKGHAEEALAALDEAIALGAPGGFVRPFVEAGPTMAALLDRRKQPGDRRFTRRLLAAFEKRGGASSSRLPRVPESSPPPGRADSLTVREIDILELLAKRYRNKEIAEELGISAATVHVHLKSIYRKLEVHGRRDAAQKATSLGIVTLL